MSYLSKCILKPLFNGFNEIVPFICFRKNIDKHSLKLKDNKPAWTIMLVGPHHSSKTSSKYQNEVLNYVFFYQKLRPDHLKYYGNLF